MSNADSPRWYLVPERNRKALASSPLQPIPSNRRQSLASSDYGSFSDSDLAELVRLTDAAASGSLSASRGAEHSSPCSDEDEDMLGDDDGWAAMELDAVDTQPSTVSGATAVADFERLLEGLTEADLEYTPDPEDAEAGAQLLQEAGKEAGIAVGGEACDRASPIPEHAPKLPVPEDAVEISKTGTRRRKAGKAPVDMFRRNRVLSVSDLSAGEWCEQQFEYNLLNFGGIPKTAQMQKGTEVHAKLEEEVHTIVKVTIVTEEDKWALRLWNFITGVQTLRDTGMTRELPVFGVLRDRAIVGFVDELAFDGETIEITDQKTRHSKGLPAKGASTRGPEMQLMLYHEILVNLPTADHTTIIKQLRLDPNKPFTEEVLLDLCRLGGDVDEIFQYNTLDKLFPFAQELYDDTVSFVDDEMKLEYLSNEGESMGTTPFEMDKKWFNGRLNAALDWWEGKRGAVGVEAAEAWKCRHCDFADDCEWRSSKAQEYVSRKRAERQWAGMGYTEG